MGRGRAARGEEFVISKILAVTAGIAVVSGAASAATVQMNFTGVGMYKSGLNLMDNGVAKTGVTAGELMWTVTASDWVGAKAGENIKTFCTDLYQYAGNGSLAVTKLWDAPVPGPAMGKDRARLIQKLYASKHSESDDSGDKAAAFQLAIWEIIYDANFNPALVGSGRIAAGIGIDAGDFCLTNQTTTFKNLVNGFLDAAFASATQTKLVALSAPHAGSSNPRQDQIYFAPLPTASALAGAGLLAMGARRRRRA